MLIAVMKRNTIFKFITLSLILCGCSSARYSNIKRAEKKVISKDNNKTGDNIKTPLTAAYPVTKSESEPVESYICIPYKKNAFHPELKDEKKIIRLTETNYPPPDDSIYVDLKHEAMMAEKYGKLGYNFAMAAVVLTFLLFIGFFLALIGIFYSGIAVYKMNLYDLELKSSKNIITGLMINAILVGVIGLVFGLLVLTII
jgi:hypothetical protein